MKTAERERAALTGQSAQPPQPGSWTVDREASTVAFSIRHLAVKLKGTFGDFDGRLEIGEDGRGRGGGTVTVASIETGNEVRDRHLLAASCFDAERHPTIDFEAALDNLVPELRLAGGLTIMGRTVPVTLRGDVEVEGGGGDLLSARLGATLSRRDFGIEWGDLFDGGLPVVGDRILVSLDLRLVRAA